jgi:hypothetical protein
MEPYQLESIETLLKKIIANQERIIELLEARNREIGRADNSLDSLLQFARAALSGPLGGPFAGGLISGLMGGLQQAAPAPPTPPEAAPETPPFDPQADCTCGHKPHLHVQGEGMCIACDTYNESCQAFEKAEEEQENKAP